MEDDARLIPAGAERDLEEIEFHAVDACVPGLVMRRGEYATGDGVTVVLLATAASEDEPELDGAFLSRLRFWAQRVDAGEAAFEDGDEPLDLVEFHRELMEDQRARHFALQVAIAEDSESRFLWLVDRPIVANRVHWYVGGDSVCVSINHGSVRFRRPGHDPLDVPATKTRGARKGCSIRAFAAADYNIEGAGRLYMGTWA
jgi:hypothetical protein